MKYYLITVLCITFFSCNRSNRLDLALEIAGENRVEVEKVLNHYKENSEDSLKYKAACFLIENMPGHYSYKNDRLSEFYLYADSVLRLDIAPLEKKDILELFSLDFQLSSKDIVEDIQIISADYLIRNIESAFENWNKNDWNRHLDFEHFCEFLLPYKAAELQEFDNWRDTLISNFKTVFTDSIPYMGEYRRFAYHPAKVINEKIRESIKPQTQSYNHPKFLNSSTIYKMPYGLCDDYSALSTSILRSQGVPTVIEYLPKWAMATESHTWHTILNSNGKNLPFIFGIESNPGDVALPSDIYPKVFRYTYARNENLVKYYQESAYHYPGFSIFRKDVTHNYMTTSNLKIPVNNPEDIDKYVYITSFNNHEWVIVDYGMVEKNIASFNNMGREIVYLIKGYDGKKLIPISDPFILHINGHIEYLKPDNNINSRKIDRKYPKRDIVLEMEKRVIGGKIQASNDKNFKTAETFYIIDSLNFPDVVQLENQKEYRYWRFYGSDKSWCNIAELDFFERDKDVSTPAKGKIIGTLDYYQNDPYWKPDNAFDGDWLTFFHYKDMKGGWIGLDLGKPVCIDRFRCVPRSDDNGIHYGDEYELKYWVDNDWKSLGRQKATGKELLFESVPENALYILNNHTRGREERLFTLENDRQIWW